MRIVISYRRDASGGHAGRLFDALNARFPGQVFLDVDGIPPGVDFVQRLRDAVAAADVLIAVIGKGWPDAADAQGRRRLDDPDDFVLNEIVSALETPCE